MLVSVRGNLSQGRSLWHLMQIRPFGLLLCACACIRYAEGGKMAALPGQEGHTVPTTRSGGDWPPTSIVISLILGCLDYVPVYLSELRIPVTTN